MPRKSPLPQREKEICERLRLYREGVGATRANFALAAKIDSNALAAIEYGRRPLRMETASAILSACRLSPAWLATGIGPDDVPYSGPLTPKELGVSPRALFSKIFDEHLARSVTESQQAYFDRPEVKHGAISFSTDNEGRADAVHWLLMEGEQWFAKVPAAKMNEFLNAVIYHAKDLLASYPREPLPKVEARRREIMRKVATFTEWQRGQRERRGEI